MNPVAIFSWFGCSVASLFFNPFGLVNQNPFFIAFFSIVAYVVSLFYIGGFLTVFVHIFFLMLVFVQGSLHFNSS